MGAWFPFGSTAIMAVGAASSNACVVHCSTFKAGGRFMTSFTRCCGRNMVAGLTFGGDTVMAAIATINNTRVVHFATLEAGG